MPAESAASGDAAAEQAAIAPVTQRVVGAHDADTFAQIFVDDGTMPVPGADLKGRNKIRDYLARVRP